MVGKKIFFISIIIVVLVISLYAGYSILLPETENDNTITYINGDSFFNSTSKLLINFSANYSWNIYDEIEDISTFYLPALNTDNDTYDFESYEVFTGIKFTSSSKYLYINGNHSHNYSKGTNVFHNESVMYYEIGTLPIIESIGLIQSAGYIPQHTYNSWKIYIFQNYKVYYEIAPFNYTVESSTSVRYNIVIDEVPEFYPYSLKWNQISCGFIEYAHDDFFIGANPKAVINGSMNTTNNDLILNLRMEVYSEDDVLIYNLLNDNIPRGDVNVSAGQYIKIYLIEPVEVHISLQFNKFNPSGLVGERLGYVIIAHE